MELTIRELIEEHLKENAINYRVLEHAPAGSAEDYKRALGTRFTQQVKVLLLKSKRAGIESFKVVAIQAQKRLNLEAIAATLDATKVKMADKAQLYAMTGCHFGELHPFSSLFGLGLLFDEDFLQEEQVYLNAGRLDCSFVVSPRAIVELEKPLLFRG